MTNSDYPVIPYQRYDPSDNPLHAMRFHWFPKPTHGFFQRDHMHILIVLDGEAVVQEPNGCHAELRPGCLWCTGPNQPCRLDPHPTLGLLEFRVVMRASWVEGICQRFSNELTTQPWSQNPAQNIFQLSSKDMDELREWIEQLMAPSCDRLTQETFLLNTLLRLREHKVLTHDTASLPVWLRTALIEMSAAKNLAGGPTRLAQLTGRSLRQVNRVCQQHLNGTATDVINRLRLEYAARALRLTTNTVEQIGENCGLRNRSYFNRLFKEAYGTSPGRYRRQASSHPSAAKVTS